MTKSDFVDKVADTSGLSKKDAGSAVDAVLKSIEDALRSGEDVSFTGFGKFTSPSAAHARAAIRVPARRCRSPRARCRGSPPARA
jgi:DNA-binding protein HU-beta